VADCEAATPGARAEQLDLLEEDSVRALFDRITERDGHLDVVVANAAATAFKPLLELKMHQIDKTFAISVRHFLLVAQLAFPLLQPRGGRIVAISGADTVGYIPGHGLLAAAKAGMETIVRYLACELGPQGVTAVGVLPGYIDTDSIKLMTGPFHDKLVAAEEVTHPCGRPPPRTTRPRRWRWSASRRRGGSTGRSSRTTAAGCSPTWGGSATPGRWSPTRW
jgi:enoyl-[acyl-carrier protein] reductase III